MKRHLVRLSLWRKWTKDLPAFALLEIALALIIFGLISSFILPMIQSYFALRAHQKTELHQQHIMAALANHVLRHHRLPCPAPDNKGKSASHCPGGIGFVPYKTLGLPEGEAKDGQNLWFTLIINPELTTIAIQTIDQGDAKSFCHSNNRLLTIEDLDLPDHDCLAVVLSSDQEPPPSLNLTKSSSHSRAWVTRDHLMALYAKRPCQPLPTFASRPSGGPPLPTVTPQKPSMGPPLATVPIFKKGDF